MKVYEISLTHRRDERGLLTAAQFPSQVPFSVSRVFVVSDVQPGWLRGGHAHHNCHQLLIPLSGEIRVTWEGFPDSGDLVITKGGNALHIPPLVWALQEYLTLGASLLVLASHEYDVNDYIDDPADAAKLRIEATTSALGK
jgi:UDP-2-acetamido-3-amino-2,3-dideoxy-glucuronate N-acetyltransferase